MLHGYVLELFVRDEYWIHPSIMPSARVPDLMICRNISTNDLLLEMKGTSYRTQVNGNTKYALG